MSTSVNLLGLCLISALCLVYAAALTDGVKLANPGEVSYGERTGRSARAMAAVNRRILRLGHKVKLQEADAEEDGEEEAGDNKPSHVEAEDAAPDEDDEALAVNTTEGDTAEADEGTADDNLGVFQKKDLGEKAELLEKIAEKPETGDAAVENVEGGPKNGGSAGLGPKDSSLSENRPSWSRATPDTVPTFARGPVSQLSEEDLPEEEVGSPLKTLKRKSSVDEEEEEEEGAEDSEDEVASPLGKKGKKAGLAPMAGEEEAEDSELDAGSTPQSKKKSATGSALGEDEEEEGEEEEEEVDPEDEAGSSTLSKKKPAAGVVGEEEVADAEGGAGAALLPKKKSSAGILAEEDPEDEASSPKRYKKKSAGGASGTEEDEEVDDIAPLAEAPSLAAADEEEDAAALGAIAKKKKLPKPTAAGVEEEEEEEIDENAAADPDEAGALPAASKKHKKVAELAGEEDREEPAAAAPATGGGLFGALSKGSFWNTPAKVAAAAAADEEAGADDSLEVGEKEEGEGPLTSRSATLLGKKPGAAAAGEAQEDGELLDEEDSAGSLARPPAGGLGDDVAEEEEEGAGSVPKKTAKKSGFGPFNEDYADDEAGLPKKKKKSVGALAGADEDEAQEAGVAPEEAPLEEAPKKKKKSSFSFGFFGSKSDPEEEAEKEGDVDSLAPAPSEADTEDVVTPLTTPGSLSASTKPGKFLGAVPVERELPADVPAAVGEEPAEPSSTSSTHTGPTATKESKYKHKKKGYHSKKKAAPAVEEEGAPVTVPFDPTSKEAAAKAGALDDDVGALPEESRLTSKSKSSPLDSDVDVESSPFTRTSEPGTDGMEGKVVKPLGEEVPLDDTSPDDVAQSGDDMGTSSRSFLAALSSPQNTAYFNLGILALGVLVMAVGAGCYYRNLKPSPSPPRIIEISAVGKTGPSYSRVNNSAGRGSPSTGNWDNDWDKDNDNWDDPDTGRISQHANKKGQKEWAWDNEF